LEKTEAFKDITDDTLNEKYAEYLKEMGTQELADQFLLSENDEVNLFNRLLEFVESNVMPTEEDGLIFA
jgi:hypothetical protein